MKKKAIKCIYNKKGTKKMESKSKVIIDDAFQRYLEDLAYPEQRIDYYKEKIPSNKAGLIKALINYETRSYNATEDRVQFLYEYIQNTTDSNAVINVVIWMLQSNIPLEEIEKIIEKSETGYDLITSTIKHIDSYNLNNELNEKFIDEVNEKISRFNGLLIEAEMLANKLQNNENIQDEKQQEIPTDLIENIKQEIEDNILENFSNNGKIGIDDIDDDVINTIVEKVKDEINEMPAYNENKELDDLKRALEEETEKRIVAENEANKYFKIICESLKNEDNDEVKEIFGTNIDNEKLNKNIDKEPDIRKKIFSFKSNKAPIEMKITHLLIKRKYSADTISKVTFAIKSEAIDKNVMLDMIMNSKSENELNTYLDLC